MKPPIFRYDYNHYALLLYSCGLIILFTITLTCTAENTKLKDYKFGSQFKLLVTKNRRRSLADSANIPPSELYYNQSSPIALNGQVHKLHCFFSGYPEPTPKWYRSGMEITQDNTEGFVFENYGKTLTFNVTTDKAGLYECKFNQHNDIDRKFTVIVESAPYWPEAPPPNVNTSEGESVTFDCRATAPYWPEAPPPNVNTSEGESVTFDCRASGKPDPEITFYKNGVELNKNEKGRKWVIDGAKLTIIDVRKGIEGAGDNAVYQCKAENKHGYLWANFYLNLLAFKPQLLDDPGELEAVEGKPFTLECKFFASPIANVTWNSPVLLGSPHTTSVDQFGVGKLFIENVEANNEGEYECVGVNKYGNARGTAKLLVRKPTHLDPFPEGTRISQAGQPIILPCSAKHDHHLDVKYSWKVNGKPLDEDRLSNELYQILSDNSLVITNPSQYDSAEYTCVASTKLDSAEKKIRVNIQDVPNPVHVAFVRDCSQDGNTAVIEFEHIESVDISVPVREFWIQYQIDPDVDNGNWRTHPVQVKAIDHEIIVGNERRVKGEPTISLKPYGKYQFRVIARNDVGDSSPMLVKRNCETASKPPSRNPDGVRVEGSQPDNLLIYWNPMPREEWYGPEFGYEIKYRPKTGGQWKTQSVDDPEANRATIELKEDQPWEPYVVQVRAKNKLGLSKVTPEDIEGRTGQGVPSVVPTNFRVDNIGSTHADFHWDPVDPTLVVGNFTGYKITFWSDDEGEDEGLDGRKKRDSPIARAIRVVRNVEDADAIYPSRRTIIFSPSVSMGTVHGLKPNALNYATISVANSQNDGTPSDVISFRTNEGVPTPVRSLNAYPMNYKNPPERGVVVLKWNHPRSANGKLLKYTIEKCRTDNGGEDISCDPPIDVPIESTEYRLTDLDYNTNYRFKVYAHTGAGEGPPNSADSKTLPEALPLNEDPVVPQLVREGIGDDYINVSFVPGDYRPDDPRPVGNSFFVRYRPEGDDDWHTKQSKDDELEVHVDGLDSGTKYDVQVVSVQTDNEGNVRESPSRIHRISTTGYSPRSARIWWILVILLIILILAIILCIVCLMARHRGRKYPVSEKERLQGRDLSREQRTFPAYDNRDDDEKKSLTGGSLADSDRGSLRAYEEDALTGFDEDGSFVGQYRKANMTEMQQVEEQIHAAQAAHQAPSSSHRRT
uniref:Neuroglian n=1 Tax=Acrobeloides nanus TaxID=290746 RepID=A0A914CE69_9BILA